VPAAAELRRVLRPGGVVGFIWNERDERVPWVHALGRLLAGETRDHEADQGVVQRFAAELPADVEVFDSAVVQRVTPEEVVRGVGTRSYAATMDEVTRAEFLGRVRALLATHPVTRGRAVVELPYTTRAYRLTPR
jgi:SAM-dependent methyltransferase